MLIGLVTKNGILIVEFANQRRDSGLAVGDAVFDAATRRLRPILMTAFSTVFGILPIALSLGDAAGSRRSLGIAVVGGLTFSTALTLYLVPAVYTFLAGARRPREDLRSAHEPLGPLQAEGDAVGGDAFARPAPR
jgi:multidrug efflux pump